MAKIEGLWYQMQITGVAPAGLTEEQIRQTMYASVSVMATAMPTVRDVAVEVMAEEPANVKKRRMLIQ